MTTSRRLHSQRGMSVFSLFAVAAVIGFLALMTMRSFPIVNEYLTIKKAVSKIVKDGPASAGDIRKAFDKQTEIEYSIVSIKGSDLDVTENNGRFTVRYKYNKEVEILDPMFLEFKFDGQATSGVNR